MTHIRFVQRSWFALLSFLLLGSLVSAQPPAKAGKQPPEKEAKQPPEKDQSKDPPGLEKSRLRPREGNLKVGDPVPALKVWDIEGKNEIALKKLKGKPVVLIFGSCT